VLVTGLIALPKSGNLPIYRSRKIGNYAQPQKACDHLILILCRLVNMHDRKSSCSERTCCYRRQQAASKGHSAAGARLELAGSWTGTASWGFKSVAKAIDTGLGCRWGDARRCRLRLRAAWAVTRSRGSV
jgi:hypothetical protein